MSDTPPRTGADAAALSADASSPSQTKPVGTEIARRYRILGLLGHGGMGVVYRARDEELDDVVALKILRHDLVSSPEMLARFRKEVKLARRVTHRNVARTFDIGEDGGDRFLTMELVEGVPLSTMIDGRAALDVGRAVEIARQMAQGMEAAHDAGVVHRDLKPDNVSITGTGRVVLMDFGIARTTFLTDKQATTGTAWGTPAYMAPEQVEAVADIDARADVYAFGTVLYELLTGEPAWDGISPYLVATARLTSPAPEVRDRRPQVSPELAALVARCMARDRNARFADGRALVQALDGLPAAAPAAPPSMRPEGIPPRRPPSTGSLSSARTSQGFEPRVGAEGLRDDIARQIVLMGDASPSYRRLLDELDALVADEPPVLESLDRVWQKRVFEGPFERPLLFLAALRADARAEGPTHPLHAAIAADKPDQAAATRAALRAAVARERIAFWITLRSRRVQTNEVTRSLAWLWPATLAGAGSCARPILLFDVGASAGLNLVAETLSVPFDRASGEALLINRTLDVRARVGFDPRPLDVTKQDDCDWLRACVWPEQRSRLERLDTAIAAFRVAVPPVELVLARASAVPARLDAAVRSRPGHLCIAYQTLVRGYVPAEEREVYDAGMRAWLAGGAPGERIHAVLELEEMERPDHSCALDVHVGVGGAVETVRLCRTSYHPRLVDVMPDAEARLAEITRPRA